VTCQVRGCRPARDDTVTDYPRHGSYCGAHARMMIPRPAWPALGVPYPGGQEPPRLPLAPVLTGPRRTRIGPLEVVYAPCPDRCGRPTCYLPSQYPVPCLGCEIGART
jgi:hypothetical protein